MTDALPLATLIDPDWRDHFRSADEAVEFYRQHARSEHDRALCELRKGAQLEPR